MTSPLRSRLSTPVHPHWLQDAAAQRLAAADELISNAPAMEELQALPSQAAEQLRSKLMPLLRKMAGLLQRVRAGRRYEQKMQHPPPDLSHVCRAQLHDYACSQIDTEVTAHAAVYPHAPRPSADLYISLLGAMRSLAGVPALAAVRAGALVCTGESQPWLLLALPSCTPSAAACPRRCWMMRRHQPRGLPRCTPAWKCSLPRQGAEHEAALCG